MSKQPETQLPGAEPLSEITLKLFTGAGMHVTELVNFERLARRRNLTKEQLMVHLIREEIAAELAVPA